MMKNTKEGWGEKWIFMERKPITPRDDLAYLISKGVIEVTDEILKEYGNITPYPHEGLVYWAGKIIETRIVIDTVIAPETDSSPGRVTVRPESNFQVVSALSDSKLIHLAQVHSHPDNWVGHSDGDDKWASFKRDGLISIVVPEYGMRGLFPWSQCGVHRFTKHEFVRLSTKYTNGHFRVVKEDSLKIDLRNKNDNRWKRKNGMS